MPILNADSQKQRLQDATRQANVQSTGMFSAAITWIDVPGGDGEGDGEFLLSSPFFRFWSAWMIAWRPKRDVTILLISSFTMKSLSHC